ncbi:MAG: hypothetical protein ACYDBY_16590, partial [Thermoanaerobaculia bacterium]
RGRPARPLGGPGDGMTPESEVILAFDVDEVLAEARRRPLPSPEVLGSARRRNREHAERFLAGMWTRALRGPVSEPHAPEWDSGVRVAVAEALAVRLLAQDVPPDLVGLLLVGWAATFTEPPLEEDEVLEIVRGLAPTARELAA